MSIEKAMVEFVPPDEGEGMEIELPVEEMIDEIVEEANDAVARELPHGANLAIAFDDAELDMLAHRVVEWYESDKRSRMDWEESYRSNLRLLGLEIEERSVPWEKACGIVHPMIAEALIRFQSTTILEMFPISGPFQAKTHGQATEVVHEAAARLKDEMNHIATKEMPEYRMEVEQGLWRLGLSGIVFRKVWLDPVKGRPVAETIPPEDIVVPFTSSHIYSTPRITQVIRKDSNETDKLIASGWWLDVGLPAPSPIVTETEAKEGEQTGTVYTHEDDGRYEFLEMQVDLDLPHFEHRDEMGEETGRPLPYVVTVEKQNLKVVAIRRNWEENDPYFNRLRAISAAVYIPGWGFYGIGLLNLLAGMSSGATAILRQTIDAGTLANLPAGFKGKQLRIKNDSKPLKPGEFREVEVIGGKIGDSIFQLRFPEPSQTLVGLMGEIITTGRTLGSIAEMPTKVGEMPVGTIVAMIEHMSRPQSAVQARIYSAFADELDMIYKIVKATRKEYRAPGNQGFNIEADMSMPISMVPVADPAASTSSVRILQSQAAVDMAAKAPQIYDQPSVHRAMLKAMGVGDVNMLIPDRNSTIPADPITENMAIMTGKPVRAGIDQDHQAHIQAHLALMGDPRMAAIIGQSPNAQAIQASMASHLAEHAAFMHRDEVLRQMGFDVPMGPMPQAIEERIAPLVAAAAQKAAQAGQAQQAKQMAEQAAEDPVVALEKESLALTREKNLQDFTIKLGTLNLKAKEVGARIAGQAEDTRMKRTEAGARLVQGALGSGKTQA